MTNVERFVSEIILPEAARQDVMVATDLHKEREGVYEFVLLYEVSGESKQRITPMLVDAVALNDTARGTALVRRYLSGIKQIITSDGLVTPDGWTTYGKPKRAGK